jgi:large subunit ribosomal protein L30
MAKKITIVQKKSQIGSNQRQRRTLEALGLGKMWKRKEVEATPQILGMVQKVSHLVEIEDK